MSMVEEQSRPRLGRGLAALIADSATQMPTPEARERRAVGLDRLRPNPRNPRRHFASDDLHDLAQSIREKGLIQPIVVRPAAGHEGYYEIIAGERRWRAAQAAALTEVPVIVIAASDQEALELAIIENVQRADLNAIEEARGYDRLSQDFGYSPGDLAKVIGKSRSHVANMLRLLKLPPSVEAMVVDGRLTAGHARALLGFDDPEPVARRIVAKGLSVRHVERLAQARQQALPVPGKEAARRGTPETPAIHPNTLALANRLSDVLGLRVSLEPCPDGGELRIRYRTLEELEQVCRRLIR
jgi:ParB family chromosome partitioning protein